MKVVICTEDWLDQMARRFFPQFTPACGRAAVLAVLRNRRK